MSEPLATQRQRVLHEAREIWRQGYVTFDTETTGLSEIDEIVQWAICDQEGAVLGSGYVKPTVEISPEAQNVHGISIEQLADAPTFDQIWPQIRDLTAGKVVVIYNAGYDIRMLYQSAEPYKIDMYAHIQTIKQSQCAMELYARYYGEWNEWHGSYRWQRLETAIADLGIEVLGQAHDAAYDASATALVIKKLAELADQELPAGWHPPVWVKCAGGCGGSQECAEADEVWYCAPCGVKVGRYHYCAGCHCHIKTPDVQELCSFCYEKLEQEKMLLMGLWHWCPGKYCSSRNIVKTQDLDEQCEHCTRQAQWKRQAEERERERQARIEQERKEAKRRSNQEYRQRKKERDAENAERAEQGLPPLVKPQPAPVPTNFTHNGHDFTRSQDQYDRPVVTCSRCLQFWRTPPRTWCLGLPTYGGWEAKPENWHTKTQLGKLKLVAEWDKPDGYVVTYRDTYRIYDIAKCTAIEDKPRGRKEQAV